MPVHALMSSDHAPQQLAVSIKAILQFIDATHSMQIRRDAYKQANDSVSRLLLVTDKSHAYDIETGSK